jgi:single-stranded DNA-binding protein
MHRLGINNVILSGHVDKTPLFIQTPGRSSLSFQLVIVEVVNLDHNETKLHKEKQYVTMHGALAEESYPLLFAGRQIYIEGKIRNRDLGSGNKTVVEALKFSLL